MGFFFIILSLQDVPTFSAEELSEHLFQIMGWHCNIKTAATFCHLEALLSAPAPAISPNTLPHREATVEDDIVIQRAKTYIQNHYAENLSREDVANAVYLDSAYFSRLFKQKMGMSFINYLTTVRMEKASEFLKTQMNVSDIAAAVGYLHRNRFITNFRQYSGYTPTEYRKKILIKD